MLSSLTGPLVLSLLAGCGTGDDPDAVAAVEVSCLDCHSSEDMLKETMIVDTGAPEGSSSGEG